MWADHAERDRRNPRLLGKDAEFHTYDELLALAEPDIEHELGRAVWDAKYQRCQEAIAALTERLGQAQPDVAVVIGDDKREPFLDDGIPVFACFAGDELVDVPPTSEALERIPKGIRAASWAAHADHPERHPVSAELSRHIAEQLTDAEFDITLFTQQPPRGLSDRAQTALTSTGAACGSARIRPNARRAHRRPGLRAAVCPDPQRPLVLAGGRALPAPDILAPQRGGRRLSSSPNHARTTASPREPHHPSDAT